jgi:GxxExxY protein
MALGELIEERLTHSVIGAFFDVYNTLGFGFLEHVYVKALEIELKERGHLVAREVAVPVFYKGAIVAEQRLDMVVDKKLVVEVKSTQELNGAAARQVYNYLRSTNLKLGLLLHFGPQARFYRSIYRKKSGVVEREDHGENEVSQKRTELSPIDPGRGVSIDPIDPKNPGNPNETSVSVVRRILH